MNFLKAITLAIISFLSFQACNDNPVDNQIGNGSLNQLPEITNITANPDTVSIGQQSILNCVARDPNNDDLIYVWASAFGTISGSGNTVTWIAPDTIDTYLIFCEVSDGHGGICKDSISIVVENESSSNLPSSLLMVPSDSFPTIQSAIDGSTDGDTVLVLPGTYYENLDLKGKNIVLSSYYLFEEEELNIKNTIIDGNSEWSVIVINKGESEDCIINGLTLKNGVGVDSQGQKFVKGGGIYCTNSKPTLRNLIITGCEAMYGAAIYCSVGEADIQNVKVEENFGKNVNIQNSVHVSQEIANLNLVTIQNNDGLGLYIQNASSVHISNLIISRNSIGGCRLNNSTNIKFKNNVICDNVGYGISSTGFTGFWKIENCTVVNNSNGFFNGENRVDVENSIFWNNSAEFTLSVVMSGYSWVEVRYSDIKGNLTSYNTGERVFVIDSTSFSLDPKFCDPEIGNYQLESNSPCVNGGENGGIVGALSVGCE